MSALSTRPALRWLVPVTAVATVIGGGAAIGRFAAQAEPSLPPRTAAQLLVDLQTSRLEGLSGTVVQRADLGLPPLADLVASRGDDLTALLAGTHTLRVWYSGPDRQRIALVDTLGEKDVIRDGRDVWVWDSRRNEATHRTLPAEDAAGKPAEPPLATTPREAADRALAAIDPSTEVSVGRAATVAGRDAYELVLDPRDPASLVGQVRIALDAREHVPLRFEVFAADSDKPAFEVAFTQVDFRRPDAAQFAFNPPPGVTVKEEPAERSPAGRRAPGFGDGAAPPDGVTTVGEGWTTVVVARTEALTDAPDGDRPAAPKAPAGTPPDTALDLLNGLPKVSGDWGSGRLFTSRLLTVLLTDDGRLLAGAVTPERLYEAARS